MRYRGLSLPDLPFLAKVAPVPFAFLHSEISTLSGGPTPAFDSTGATIMVVVETLQGSSTVPDVTDNFGNVYLRATGPYSNGARNAMIFACQNPVVGPGHVITGNYGLVCAMAFSGAPSIAETTTRISNSFSNIFQPGIITPSTTGQLFISAANGDPNTGGSENIIISPLPAQPGWIQVIDRGSNIFSGIPHLSAAYKIKSPADSSNENPVWNSFPLCVAEVSMANFRRV